MAGLPEDHEGDPRQETADKRPVGCKRDVVAVFGHPKLDEVGSSEGYEVRVGRTTALVGGDGDGDGGSGSGRGSGIPRPRSDVGARQFDKNGSHRSRRVKVSAPLGGKSSLFATES